MEKEDSDAAERAVITLTRNLNGNELFDVLLLYAIRNPEVHPWICLSNSWRILKVIGWEHTEPVARMLVRTLASREDWSDPVERPDRELTGQRLNVDL